MKRSIILCLMFISAGTMAVENPLLDFAQMVRDGEKIYKHRNYDECPIIKIEKDLDQDGDTDYLLSSRCPYGEVGGWGNAGGAWLVYFNKEGEFLRTRQEIFMHPLASRISATGQTEEFKIEYYHRMNCCEGSFIAEIVSLESRTPIPSQSYKDMNVEGSEGYERYKTTFGSNSRPEPKLCLLKAVETEACGWKDGYY